MTPEPRDGGAKSKSRRVDYAAERRKRIDQLRRRHDELWGDGREYHDDGYMVCGCQCAGELRAVLRLDALAQRKGR